MYHLVDLSCYEIDQNKTHDHEKCNLHLTQKLFPAPRPAPSDRLYRTGVSSVDMFCFSPALPGRRIRLQITDLRGISCASALSFVHILTPSLCISRSSGSRFGYAPLLCRFPFHLIEIYRSSPACPSICVRSARTLLTAVNGASPCTVPIAVSCCLSLSTVYPLGTLSSRFFPFSVTASAVSLGRSVRPILSVLSIDLVSSSAASVFLLIEFPQFNIPPLSSLYLSHLLSPLLCYNLCCQYCPDLCPEFR